MSDAVERKILEMQFDNAEFERRVAKSMRTIESLKKEMDFDESAKSLDRLERAANDISFKGLEKETRSLGDLFDWGSIFKITLLQKVANQVIGTASRMLKSLTIDNVSAGMTKYEMKTKSVQTIMAATGRAVEDVEKVLERLNYYTDMTSYDFADMTNNIGKFTSAGIDLEVAEVAMEGIANWAAVSGQETAQAARAMYNMSQALSAGHVKLIDWKSIENANMATKEFKEYVIETAIGMGKLQRIGDKVGKTLKGTSVDFKNFSQTLSEGWFDNDVLIATLTQYADTNTEIGAKSYDAARKALTFTQSMQAVRDSISTGWMKTWQLLFGDVEEAGDFFTELCDSIIKVTERIDEARNNLLQEWRDFTSIFTDDNSNHYKGKDMASLIFHTVWDTIVSVGAAISRAMEMVANPSSVLFGNGGFDTGGWKIAFDEIEDLATGNMLGKVTDGILNMANAVRSFLYGNSIFGGQRIVKLVHIFTGFFSLLDIGRQIIGSILGFVGRIAMFLSPLIDGVLEIGSAIGDVLYMIDLSLRSGGLKALGDSLFEFLRPALEWIRDKGRVVIDWILEQIRKIPGVLETITKRLTSFLNTLTRWGKKIKRVFDPIARPLQLIWDTVKGWFSGEGLENLSLWDKIQTVWDRIKNTDFSKWKISFDVAFDMISARFNNLLGNLKRTVKEKWGIDLSWVDTAIQSIRRKWGQFTNWWQGTSVYKWFTEKKDGGNTGFMQLVYDIGDAFKNAWDFFTEPDENGETGFQRWKQNLLDRCKEIRDAITDWKGWSEIGKFFSGLWKFFTEDEMEERFENGETTYVSIGTKFQQMISNVKRELNWVGLQLELWWNSDATIPTVLKTIGNAVADGFNAVWGFFNDKDENKKTGFDRWKENLISRYTEIETEIKNWKGWTEIGAFFSGIWDYFTKPVYRGDELDENGNFAKQIYRTGFEQTFEDVKGKLEGFGIALDRWWNSDNIIVTTLKTIGTGISNAATAVWEYFTKSYRYVGDEGAELFEGTEFEHTIYEIKNWFIQAGNDISEWWNGENNYLRIAFEVIGNALSHIWDYFTLPNPDYNGKTGFEQTIEDVKTKLEEMRVDIEKWWNDDGKVIPNTLKKIGKGISEGLTTMWNYFTEGIYIGDKYDAQGNYLGPEFQTAFEGDVEEVKAWFKRVGKDLEDWWKKDDNYLRKAFEFIHGEIENLLGWFQSESSIRYESQEGQSPFFTFFQNLGEDITNAWKDATKEGTFLGDLFGVVSGFFSGIWEAAFGKPDSSIDENEIRQAWLEYKMKFNGAIGSAMVTDFNFSGGGKARGDMMTYEEFKDDYIEKHVGVLGFFRTVWEKIQEWVNKIKNSDAYKTVAKFFSDLWESVKGFFTEIDPETGKTGWKQTLDDVIQWISDTYEKVKEWGGWTQVGDFFKSVFGSIGDFFKSLFGGREEEKKVEANAAPAKKKGFDPVAVQFGVTEEQVEEAVKNGKKEIRIFELLDQLLESIGGILGGSGVTEVRQAGELLSELAEPLQAVWDAAVSIIKFIADKNPLWMGVKYLAFRMGIGMLSGVISGLTIFAEHVGLLLGSGLIKILGKRIPGLSDLLEIQDSLPKLLFSIAAIVAAFAFASSVFGKMSWEGIAKIGVGLVLIIGAITSIIVAYNKTAKDGGALISFNKTSDKTAALYNGIAKVFNTIISGMFMMFALNTVLSRADDVNKLDSDKAVALGQLMLDLFLGLSAAMLSMSVALKLTKGMSATEMIEGAVGIGGAISALLVIMMGMGSLFGGIDKLGEATGGTESDTTWALKQFTNKFVLLGEAIGELVGAIVDGYEKMLFKGREERKAEEIMNSAANAISFAQKITGLSDEAHPEDLAAFEQIVDYIDRLSKALSEMASVEGAAMISGISGSLVGFANDVNKIYNILSSSFDWKRGSDEDVEKTMGALRELIWVIEMMVGLVELVTEKAEKLNLKADENNRVIGKNGLDLTTMSSGIYEAIKAMLMQYEVDEGTLGEPLIYELGRAMGEYYKGLSDTISIDQIGEDLPSKISLAISSNTYEFKKAGKAGVTAIAEGMLEGKSVIVSIASLLGTAALASYNKSAGTSLKGASEETLKEIQQYTNGTGFDLTKINEYVDMLNHPEKLVSNNGLADLSSDGMMALVSKIFGVDFTSESDMSAVGDQMALFFVGEDGTGGAIGTVLSEIASVWSGEGETLGVNDIVGEGLAAVSSTVNDYSGEMEKSSKNLINGLANGLRNNVKDATEAAAFVARQVLLKFHQVWEIHSPSEETEQDAVYLIEGLSNGLAEEGPVFIAEIEQFAGDVGDIFAEEFSSRIGAAMVPEMDTGSAFNSLVKTWDDVSKVYGKETPDWADVPMSTILDRAKEKVEEAMNPDDAKDTGRKYSEALTNTIKGIFDLADSDLTYEPVIRPIIDWSNVTANVGYGGRILSGMPGFTGGTYAAGTLEETMKIHNGKNNGDLYNVVVDIRDKVDQLDQDVMNMKIVLNTGVLAGELVNDIDNELGQRVLNNGRAN